MESLRTKHLTSIINKTSKAPARIQKKFMMDVWNQPVSRLQKVDKAVKVVNKRIIV
ncbi:MAG: hypothetical protein ABSB31_08495 [Dehalococcoidia bacterium]|jgi:hypothetical protein